MSSRPTSFYYSFLVLPPVKRDAVIAVWDFCRAVDDAVDEPGQTDPRTSIEEWRREVSRIFDGAPASPEGRRLRPIVREFNLSREPFDDLIDGVSMDLDGSRYETFEELKQYCLRVASAVGLMCVQIFGYRDVHSRDYAIDLGIALQLTNIVRDLRSDLDRGRLYIPLEDLRRYDCSDDDLRAGVMTDGIRRLLMFELERARHFYQKAEGSLPQRDAKALMPARIMAAIYLDIIRAIEHAGYDVFRTNIRVSRPRQAYVAARTWLAGTVGWDTLLGAPDR
jgi:phytoene synthase